MTYSKTMIYETPLVEVTGVSTESGFADSGAPTHNAYGLQDITGTDVTDQSGDWN